MARVSETRARVRNLAIEWTKQGRELSPRAIMRELGTGSASTVVDELRKLRGEAAFVALSPSPPGHHTDAHPIEGPAVVYGPTSASAAQSPRPSASAQSDGDLHSLVQALTAEIAKVVARFDAAQRRSLVDIDQAREAARYWKDVAERNAADHKAQLESYRANLLKEVERANLLQGRLTQLEKSAGGIR